MVNFSIVVEGGGTGPALKAEMAQGFSNFFAKLHPGFRRPRLIRGGGRTQALDKFVTAWNSRKGHEVVLLLIDSEEPVTFGDSKIARLKNRDGWKDIPVEVQESDIFLMVSVMETWLLSDRDTLKLFYKGGFQEKKLPAVEGLENLHRSQIYEALQKATADCKERAPYSKGKHSFELIGLIDPAKLEVLPHAKQFLDKLRALQNL